MNVAEPLQKVNLQRLVIQFALKSDDLRLDFGRVFPERWIRPDVDRRRPAIAAAARVAFNARFTRRTATGR